MSNDTTNPGGTPPATPPPTNPPAAAAGSGPVDPVSVGRPIDRVSLIAGLGSGKRHVEVALMSGASVRLKAADKGGVFFDCVEGGQVSWHSLEKVKEEEGQPQRVLVLAIHTG